ncbi:MAG TPA: S41 family peptidase [Thermoanaerobaculia bacterium]|nr:S41 family peptidase [Thermoanaerobaculia bacterium]
MRIPARELQADFAVLKRALEELHPGLYRYNTREQMAAHFAELQAALNRDLTIPEAYLAISTFTAKIRCGHSHANFVNQPKAVAAALTRGAGRVPFTFRWIDRRMIVTGSFAGAESLKPGTEILSLNGVPAGTVLDRLLTITRADGSNDAKRVSQLEATADYELGAFDVFFPLFFPLPDGRLQLQIREPLTGKKGALTVPAIPWERPRNPNPPPSPRGSDPVWAIQFLDADTAYLPMSTWALYDSKWDWKAALKQTFDDLARRKTANLIVDLRDNEGGQDVGDEILSRVIQKPLAAPAFERRVRYRKAPDDLIPYLDTWDPSFKDWKTAATDLGNGFYRLVREWESAEGDVIQPVGPRFEGKLWVLVSANNSSATFQFAQAVQEAKAGTLVGQPTGGNRRGINGGAFFFLRLPNSKIEVDIPLIGYFPAAEQPDTGVQPDIAVQPSAEDIARGIDRELATVRERIKR